MTANRGSAERGSDTTGRPGTPEGFEHWISEARAGCPDALGRLTERCRQYLMMVANKELNGDIKAKVGASDLVQETLLTAQQIFPRFEGCYEGELEAWLRRILLNKIQHVTRSYYHAAKRDIRREQRIDDDSAAAEAQAAFFADSAPTPRSAAAARELAEAVDRALQRLPADYRQAVILRSFERHSFVTIGELLNASPDAARKTWCRAVRRLKKELLAHNEPAPSTD